MDATVGRSKIPFVTLSLDELRNHALPRAANQEEARCIEKAIADREAAGLDKIKFGRYATGSQLERMMASEE